MRHGALHLAATVLLLALACEAAQPYFKHSLRGRIQPRKLKEDSARAEEPADSPLSRCSEEWTHNRIDHFRF